MARKIQHPKSNSKVHQNFVAFGTAERMKKGDIGATKGEIFDKDDNLLFTGTTIHERPNWVVLFECTDGVIGLHRKVKITHWDGTPQTQTEIEVTADAGVQITYPANNDNICTTFTSYGTTTNIPSQVSGTMTRSDAGATVDGTTIQQPTPGRGTWVIQFNSVPESGANTYALDVSDTQGGFQEHTGINVAVANC
jgi:hypothetical protein